MGLHELFLDADATTDNIAHLLADVRDLAAGTVEPGPVGPDTLGQAFSAQCMEVNRIVHALHEEYAEALRHSAAALVAAQQSVDTIGATEDHHESALAGMQSPEQAAARGRVLDGGER